MIPAASSAGRYRAWGWRGGHAQNQGHTSGQVDAGRGIGRGRWYEPAKDLVGRSLSTMPKWPEDFLDKAHSMLRKPTKPDRLVGERAVT